MVSVGVSPSVRALHDAVEIIAQARLASTERDRERSSTRQGFESSEDLRELRLVSLGRRIGVATTAPRGTSLGERDVRFGGAFEAIDVQSGIGAVPERTAIDAHTPGEHAIHRDQRVWAFGGDQRTEALRTDAPNLHNALSHRPACESKARW